MSNSFQLTLQAWGCAGLTGLLLIEWTVLRTLTWEVLVLKHLYEPRPTSEDEVLNVRIKPFRATLLDSSDAFTDLDLLGRVTTLVFLLPSKAGALIGPVLLTLWEKRLGPLHIVCSGTMDECESIRDAYRLGPTHNSAIDIILDTSEVLRRHFSVSTALGAIIIDADGRVMKVGSPTDASKEPRTRAAS